MGLSALDFDPMACGSLAPTVGSTSSKDKSATSFSTTQGHSRPPLARGPRHFAPRFQAVQRSVATVVAPSMKSLQQIGALYEEIDGGFDAERDDALATGIEVVA